MRRVAAAALALLATPAPAAGPRLLADLSQSRVDISYRFAGAELLVFGAIQYPGPPPRRPPGLAIVVRGPTQALTVRRKERVAGIWVNRTAVRFETVPGFYALATTPAPQALLGEREATIYEVGVGRLQLSPASATDPATIDAFTRGLVDMKRRAGLFVERPGGASISQGVLYQARVPMPSAVPVGDYAAEIYLIADGRVIARATRPIRVDKTGAERAIYLFAQEHALAYGLTAVLLALGFGWAASAIGRR